jgi:hypothetical protein
MRRTANPPGTKARTIVSAAPTPALAAKLTNPPAAAATGEAGKQRNIGAEPAGSPPSWGRRRVRPPGPSGKAEASQLARGRSHRLETMDPALFHELSRTNSAVVDSYCRQLTEQVAFGGAELSRWRQRLAKR